MKLSYVEVWEGSGPPEIEAWVHVTEIERRISGRTERGLRFWFYVEEPK